MFDGRLRHRGQLRAFLVPPAILATTLAVAPPVHAFGLGGAQVVEGIGKAADVLKAAEEAERQRKGVDEQFVDDQIGVIADRAADEIERGSIKAGTKAWDALVKSDSKVGDLAKKAARRWGPAVRRGLRLAGPAGRVVDTAEAGYTVGTAIARAVTMPLIDRYFDGKSRELEEQIRRDVEEIRQRAEFSRTLDEDIAAYERASRAMDEEERRLYGPRSGGAANDSWSDNASGAGHGASSSVTANEPDPWKRDDSARRRQESERAKWGLDAGDEAWRSDGRTRGCQDDWGGCPGDEYWNEELQAKAREIDPWAAYREASGTGPTTGAPGVGADHGTAFGARDCEEDWADCSATGPTRVGIIADRSGLDGSQGQEIRSEPGDPPGVTHGTALAGSPDDSADSDGRRSATSQGTSRKALDRLDEDERMKLEEAERQREREQAEEQSRQAHAGSSTSSATTSASSPSGNADLAARAVRLERERQAEERERQAEERERRSRAHLERTLEIAALQRRLDSALAACEHLEPTGLCWNKGTPEGRAACRQRFDQEKRMIRSGCRDRARSDYERAVGFLMLNNP